MGDYLDTVLGHALSKAQRENDGAQLTKEEVKGAAAEAFDEVVKGRRYIDDPSEAPEGVEVQEGERGGLYYVVGEDDGGGDSSGSGGGSGGESGPKGEAMEAIDALREHTPEEHLDEVEDQIADLQDDPQAVIDFAEQMLDDDEYSADGGDGDGGDAGGGLSEEGEEEARNLGWDKAKAFQSYGSERAADKIVDRAESRAEELGEDPQAFAEQALDTANHRYPSIPDSEDYFGDGADFTEEDMRDLADNFDPEARAAQYQHEDMSPGQIVDQAWRDTREAVMDTIQEESGGDFDYEDANRVATDLADQVREAARERY